MTDTPLLDWHPPVPFIAHGDTFVEARDGKRLGRQCQAVYDLMRDGQKRTLSGIAEKTGALATSVSARWRNLREYGFILDDDGGNTFGDGRWLYWMVLGGDGRPLRGQPKTRAKDQQP